VESFNGTFRGECLNEHSFRSLDDAREIIGAWCAGYNRHWLNSALGYPPPPSSPQLGVPGVAGMPGRMRTLASVLTNQDFTN
jgi:hypothetical protein